MLKTNRRKLIFIFIALIIIVVILFYLFSGQKQAYGTLAIISSPPGATIKIDNDSKEYKTPTIINGVVATKHKVYAKSQGMVDIEKEITIEADKENKLELVFSTGGTEPNVINISRKDYQDYLAKHPLVKYLPYKTNTYKMEYASPNTDTYFVWVYSGYKGDIELIKKELFPWIKSKGVDPTALKIEWKTD